MRGVASLLLVLAACASGPRADTVAALATVPPVAQWLSEVRDPRGDEDAIEITPLRDLRTDELRARAAAAEGRGDPGTASALIDEALATTPDDPLLLQEAAELALHAHDWNRAGELAARSYALGSRIGALCRRNWRLQQVLRAWLGDVEGAAQAQAQVQACTLAAPVRM